MPSFLYLISWLGGASKVKPRFYVINPNLVCRCVELLIAYDANINHAADGGQTPLYLACKNENKECIKLLLEAGTNRSVKTTVSTTLVIFFPPVYIICHIFVNSTTRKTK